MEQDYEIRNARFVGEDAIALEWNHPELGWIPFTATAGDPEQHGRDIYALTRATAAPQAPIQPTSADVDREHDRRAALGKAFTVTGYGEVPLEGSLRTQTVLLALKDTARDMQAAGVTAPILFFTDRDNADHYLTPAQVIELVNAGKAYMQALHTAKRSLKELNPIPADYADDSRWPS